MLTRCTPRARTAVGHLVLLACFITCGCGEDVLRLGKSEQSERPLVVERILLKDAQALELLSDLTRDPKLSLATLESPEMSLEALVSGSAASVEFIVDNDVRVEHEVPFTYPGDTPSKLQSFSAELGEHTVTATPYSELEARGERGTSLTRTFTFVE